jgi:hypothetical protein
LRSNLFDLVNTWSYADAYPDEIAAAIRANNEASRLYMDEQFPKVMIQLEILTV